MRDRRGQILIRCLAACLLATAAACVLLSLLPYDAARGHLDPYFGGAADRYDQAFHQRLMSGLRWLAVTLSAAGIALACLGRPIGARVDRLREAQRASALRWWRALRAGARTTPRSHLVALTLIVATGIAVRVWHLGQPIRYDEALTYQHFASKPLYIAIAHYDYGANNHLFHTLLANLSMTIFGDAAWALRLPAFLAGVLMIPAAYALGRCFLGPLSGLFCAALVAGWPAYILYSTNARGYTLLTLSLAATVLVGARLVSRPGEDFLWTLWILAAALGFYSHPGFLLPFPGMVAWMALEGVLEARREGRSAAPLLGRIVLALAAVGAVTAALYAPVLVAWGFGPLTGHKYVTPAGMGTLSDALPELGRSILELWHLGLPAFSGVVTLCAAALLVAVGTGREREGRVARLLLLLLAGSAAIVLAGRFVLPGRTFLPLLVVTLLAAVGGVSVLVRWVRLPARPSPTGRVFAALAVVTSVVLGAGTIASGSVLGAPGGRGIEDLQVAEYLMETLEPDDRVVAFFPYGAPLYYYFRSRDGDTRYLRFFEASAAERVFVVEATGAALRIPDGFEADLFTSPRAVERIGGTIIYRLDRRTASAGA